MGTKKTPARRTKPNAEWKVVRVETTRSLYRLIAPLQRQKGRQKTITIAIGGKRLKAIVDALNEMGVEV